MSNTTFYACDLLGEQIKLLKAIKDNLELRESSILLKKNNIDRILQQA